MSAKTDTKPQAQKPVLRPFSPYFSCGPVKKHPGWSLDALGGAMISRSHRSSAGVARIAEAIDRTHALLGCPEDYKVAMLPGSDTGAMEAAMWSLLGARGVDVFSCDEFGRRWVLDARDELKPDGLRIHEAPYGELFDLSQYDPSRDAVFTYNATAAGVRLPDFDWIAEDREGLTICDATSATFALPIDWAKVDVLTYSWQKCLGGEAQHGMIVLSPRALERLASHRPSWPTPRLLQLYNADGPNMGLFQGKTLNTPSLLCVEDYLLALKWVARIGGLEALHARAAENFQALDEWVRATGWVEYLCADPATRSPAGVTLKFADPEIAALSQKKQWKLSRQMGLLLERENAALDVTPHPAAPAGLRIWCGPTVEAEDLSVLGPWLDWAYETARAG
jgi:phosphoserine aminotransferase